MPLRNAEISRHAWLRFLDRWQGDPPECYRTKLEEIMAGATEEHLGYGTTIRMINHTT